MFKKKAIILLLIFGIVLFALTCTIKSPVEMTVEPVISDLTVPDTLYLQNQNDFPLSVRVSDPQGLKNILHVLAIFYEEADGTPMQVDTLRDDGTNGDIITGDGLYFSRVSTDFTGDIAGTYLILVFAEDRDGNTSEVLLKNIEAVDEMLNQPPVITNPQAPDTLTSTTLPNVFLSIQANDPQGLADISSVVFQVFHALSPTPMYADILFDDGSFGDITAGDGVFSIQKDLSDTLKISGNYLIRFQAIDMGGLSSLAIVVPVFIELDNDPPILGNLSAPDTISRNNANNPILISIQAYDPQGLNDVQSVYFNSFKPDSSPSGGNPFQMFDDGTQGDVTNGDGVYSLNIEIWPTNDLGDYTFHFIARDLAGALSDTLIHVMTVVD